jgi:hypothetical protein
MLSSLLLLARMFFFTKEQTDSLYRREVEHRMEQERLIEAFNEANLKYARQNKFAKIITFASGTLAVVATLVNFASFLVRDGSMADTLIPPAASEAVSNFLAEIYLLIDPKDILNGLIGSLIVWLIGILYLKFKKPNKAV